MQARVLRQAAAIACAASVLPIVGPVAAAGERGGAEGARVFQHCYACHSVDPAETNLPGPNLAGVVGRRAASLAGFDYSPALRALGAQGLVWSEEALDRYLSDPEAMVPGTLMAVNGLGREERAQVIAYLKGAGSRQPR